MSALRRRSGAARALAPAPEPSGTAATAAVLRPPTPLEPPITPQRGVGSAAGASPTLRPALGALLSAGLHGAAVALTLGAFGVASPPPRAGAPVATVSAITDAMFESVGSRAPDLPRDGPSAPDRPRRHIPAQDPTPGADQDRASAPAATPPPPPSPALAADARPRVDAAADAPPELAPPSAPSQASTESAHSDDARARLEAAGQSGPSPTAVAAPTPTPRQKPRQDPPRRTATVARAPDAPPAGAAATPSGSTTAATGEAGRRADPAATPTGPEQPRTSLRAQAGQGSDSGARARYRADVSRRIERAKRAGSGGEGVGAALVELTIDAKGSLVGARLAESSGLAVRDAAALSTVRRAAPFPPPPPELASNFVVLRVHFR